jgi:hypothetical protein
MGFWEGLGKAMESNEQQRNVENARSDRKAETDKADARYDSETAFRQTQWENTLSEQKRRRGLEDAALTQAEEDRAFARDTELFDRAGTNLYSGTSVAGGTPGGGTKTGSTPTGSTRQGLETSIATLKHLGADNSTLTDLAGHGGPALAAVLEGYNKAVETATNIGGVPKPDINDYIRDTTFLTVDGEVPTMELMMERMGKTEEQMLQPANGSSGPTWEDVFKSKYTIPTQVTPILPGGVPEGLDISGITAVTGQITDSATPFIEQTISDNRAKINSPDITEKERKELVEANVKLNNALKDMEGGNAKSAFDALGPDAANLIIPFLANKPGAENSNFGPPYDSIIQSRTFNEKDGKSDVDIAKLASTGDLRQGDWYFQDGVAKKYAGLPSFNTDAEALNWGRENPELSTRTPFAMVGGVLSVNQTPQKPLDSTESMVAPEQDSMPAGLGGSEGGAPSRMDPAGLGASSSEAYPDIQNVTNQQGSFLDGSPNLNDGQADTSPFDLSRSERAARLDARAIRNARNNEDQPAPETEPRPDYQYAEPKGDLAAGLTPPSAIQEEDSQLLIEYMTDQSVPPEMLDKMAEEFLTMYGPDAFQKVIDSLPNEE